MRLKKLEILGFKSFADKTKLEFDPGITAVVGPNGCGKSNIADAFRWVLGEQSAKSMRGHKMPDVIFAGTSQRKPLNFAEVTITLTDIEGMLPIDYEEIAVTRRLHRSGESEYFINRHPVRLKDVQGLFLDTGMGKDAYSIFEQGKIDQVINLSPLERRYIFEEAAGILRFLQRKREALKKLEQTELNVSRVKDIHQEVERQIIVLEQQAEKARQYKENKGRLEKLEKILLLIKWDRLNLRLTETKKRTKNQEAQISEVTTLLENLNSQLLEAKQLLMEAEKGLQIHREEVFKVRSAKEIQTKEKQSQQERLKELLTKEKRWQQELEGMALKREYRKTERLSLEKKIKSQELSYQEIEREVKVQREKVKELDSQVTAARESQQIKNKDAFKLFQIENQLEGEMRQANVRLENALDKHKHLIERKESLFHSIQALQIQLEEKKRQQAEMFHTLDLQKNTFSSTETDLEDIVFNINQKQEEIERLNQEIGDAKARQRSLQRLREDMEGFSAGSKRLLQESENSESPLFNKIKGLYEYFTAEKEAQEALAAVMKPYSQTLVVETETDFCLVTDFAKKCKIKDISLVCIEALGKIKGRKSSSSSVQGLSPLSMHVLENELARHFLQGIYVADLQATCMETIKNGSGIEIWMAEGAFVDRRSVIFYASQGENNVFLREAELKALDKKLHKSEEEKKVLEGILKTLQQKCHHLQAERSELDKAIRKGEMRLMEANFGLQKISTDLDKLNLDEKVVANELQNVTRIIEEYTKTLNDLKERHVKAKANAQEAHKQNEMLSEQLNVFETTMRSHAADLKSLEDKLRFAVDESRKQIHALNLLEVKDQESLQQENRLEEEIEIGRSLHSQIELKEKEVDKALDDVEHALNDVLAGCSELEQRVDVRRNALERLESKINDKRQVLKKHEGELHQISIQSAHLESNNQALENELLERFRLNIEEARMECGEEGYSEDQTEREMKALRQEIENAGDINMTSIEECEKHKVRYQFLNQQIDDLDVSKQELVSIIAQLDGESRKIFKATFEQIRNNFKKNFKILFTGGEADLQFTETADVLEAGIEIIAQPPGKQMRSINLLSGGEKCLTAMALLFAIFEVKPAPFCILDEIDAPLDDTNVERFVNIVRQFVNNCQFIIITHNKRTMAIADIIVGVSMEEKGVSKLLSIDFSKNSSPELVSA